MGFVQFQAEMIRNYTRRATTALILLLVAGTAVAQLPSQISDSSVVSILTINPGSPVYSAWGHSALRIQDPDSRIDAVFSWGTFDVDRPYFLPRFAYGDMLYQLSVEPMTRLMQRSQIDRRDVIEQELRLRPGTTTEIWSLLVDNLREENRSYQYDFVRDNCSTRILDILEATGSITLPEDISYSSTYREMIDEYIHSRSWLDLGIDLVFGSRMDSAPALRTRSFLPIYLLEILDESNGYDGQPLVGRKRTLAEYGESPADDSFPAAVLIFWGLSLLFLLFTVWQLRESKLTGPTRSDRGLLAFFGFVGLFLLAMWFFTLHWVTAVNLNVAWALPSHFVVAIAWKRWGRLQQYLRYSAYWTVFALILQLVLAQSTPPALVPVVAVLAFRMWAVSR